MLTNSNSLEQDYLRQASSGIVKENDAATGEQVVKIKFSKPVPIEIASVVSDAANNLRDSLDHAGYATAQAAKKGSHPKTHLVSLRSERRTIGKLGCRTFQRYSL